MKIQITEVAKQEINQIESHARQRVIQGIRDHLPDSTETDPTLTLEEAETEVSVHSLGGDDPLVLYRVFDVDGDGKDEIVVLTLIDREELQTFTESSTRLESTLGSSAMPESTTRSARIGHELLEKIGTNQRLKR